MCQLIFDHNLHIVDLSYIVCIVVMDVLMAYMTVFRQFSLHITVSSNLQLILTTHKQFREYFEIIEATKEGKAKFNKILEVRVEEKDKKKILEARDKEKTTGQASPVY